MSSYRFHYDLILVHVIYETSNRTCVIFLLIQIRLTNVGKPIPKAAGLYMEVFQRMNKMILWAALGFSCYLPLDAHTWDGKHFYWAI
ncbi:hypothetical protein L2E82_41311 [Cichorium intybus]|uniref:Uncharacterized protein n=1 Tax=Cichorium intybus TaxID=13427 RepID=A0ACB9ANU7_CICIN|nr:hypothetical protein L2E82_41311 [Cichorium intybus]